MKSVFGEAARRGAACGVALTLALGGLACRGSGTQAGGTRAEAPSRYYCPMHPTYVSGHPGDCPICGMALVPRRDHADDAPRRHEVGGRATVTLTTERRQMLGVRSAELRPRRLARDIRTVGRVAVDERRLYRVHTRYEGYVERLYVDFTGQLVKKGDPLLAVYSPELVATQEEYLLAWRAQQQLARSGIPSVMQGGHDLREAARERLELWDFRTEDISNLGKTTQVMRAVDLYAGASGYVVEKNVSLGVRVMPADTLYTLADLSHLWVLADVYEVDLPSVRLGMTAEVTVTYLPGRAWRGPITYIAPTVDEKTRTIKVRIEVDNPNDALKPDMFADVVLRSELGTGLVLPDDAVIHSGDRALVFLDHGEGRFEPRAVKLGAKVEGGLHVLAGLTAGDRVVVAANFLLDSESSLKGALASMEDGGAEATPPSDPTHEHRH